MYVRKFVGTHNFHNYTKKGDPKKKCNQRYIMSMEVERVSKEALEKIWGKPTANQYVIFRLHGQSFIYHQIRKMIGSMIQIFQEDNDEEFIVNSFTHNKTPVWLAPSQGLLLDRVLIDSPDSLHSLQQKDRQPRNPRSDSRRR